MTSLKDDMEFFRNENTSLSLENAELKYKNYTLEEDISTTKDKLLSIQHEVSMQNDLIVNMKDGHRKIETEYNSLVKSQKHSQELIRTLEGEKMRLEHEVNKFNKNPNSLAFTQQAILAKDKAMNDLAMFENRAISKMNKVDKLSEFVQTTLCDIKNVIVMKKPSEVEKPEKPGK